MDGFDDDATRVAFMRDTQATHPGGCYLLYTFPLPEDAGVRIMHAWTRGGGELGDQVDAAAAERGYDGLDYRIIAQGHVHGTTHGRVRVAVHPLAELLRAVTDGDRPADVDRARVLDDVLETVARTRGQAEPRTPLSAPPWPGVGPAQLDDDPGATTQRFPA